MRELSELEGTVLGVVDGLSSCTAYAVRKTFKESPVHHWQASAGAIYPAMERLERKSLLSSERVARGRQTTRRYSITASGVDALRCWLMQRSERLGIPPDPLRTRIFFFDTLAPQEKEQVLTGALGRLDTELLRLREDCRKQESADRNAYYAAKGALAVALARKAWIEEMLRDSTGTSQGSSEWTWRAGRRPSP